MDNLRIDKTKHTLAVNFNGETGVLELKGSSYPENAMEFYKPIQEWLRSFLAGNPKTVTLKLKLEYLNTSSSKCLLDVLSILEEKTGSEMQITVKWYYEADDEDMLEIGEDFAKDLDLNFEFISF